MLKRSAMAVLVLVGLSRAQPGYVPTPENLKAREWFQDAKFGLFIHWGIYSVLGDGEWVMQVKKIPIHDYEKLASFFNPIDFDPNEWVSLAKAAGMKYITITSKHHDGFCLFDSKLTDWDIVDRTPYGKDVLKRHPSFLYIIPSSTGITRTISPAVGPVGRPGGQNLGTGPVISST